jgi:hypothetical protein
VRGNPYPKVSPPPRQDLHAPDVPGFAAGQEYGDILGAALTSGNWRRPELSLTRGPSDARQLNVAKNSETWRDQLLTEIEEHVAELRGKMARYALFRSGLPLRDASGDQAAVEWMHQALEDIAATALGIELASHEGLHRIRSAAELDLIDEITEPNTGTTG